MTSETKILQEIRLGLCKGDTRLFRNNVGVAEMPGGRMVRFGLHPGSSDLIGWHTVTITPAMVGGKVAIFAAIETKAPRGRRERHQQNFIEQVREAGGLAGFARSVDEAVKIIRGGD